MKNKTNDNLIFELRGRFINLPSNHDIDKMRALQTDCEDYLATNEDNEYKHIENTIHILKSLIDYHLNDNRKSAYEKILPMLENLEFGEKIGLFESDYNRNLLVYSIFLAKDYKQANTILNIIEKSFEAYPVKESLKAEYMICSYINFIEILLHSKLCGKTTDIEVGEIKVLYGRAVEEVKEIISKEGKEGKEEFLIILSLKKQQYLFSEYCPRGGDCLTKMRECLIQLAFTYWNAVENKEKVI